MKENLYKLITEQNYLSVEMTARTTFKFICLLTYSVATTAE